MRAGGIWGWRSSQTPVVGLAFAAFALSCVLPTAYLFSLLPIGIDRAYGAVLLDVRQRGLLYNTALLGMGAAALATAIGMPLGIALARVPLARKPILRLALAAPVLLPPYVVGLAWVYLGSSRGLIAGLAGRDLLSKWTYSLPAAVVVLSLVFYPLAMLATEVAIRRIDGRLEEAASIVAPPHRVLLRITLPLAAPTVLAAALVIFVLAVSEFGVPGLLRVRVYTTEVFTAFSALYDFTRAVLLAVPLLLLCILVAAVAAMLLGTRLVITRRSSGVRPALFDMWRRPASAGVLIVAFVALGLPVMTFVREAVGAQSVRAVIAGSGQAIVNSLTLSAVGATAVVAVATWIGYARARAGSRSGHLVDILLIVLFGVPSTIVGIGLIAVWNRPGVLGAVYATDAMFLLAYLARFVPVAALILGASMRSVPVSHEEAAAVGGAGWLRTMTEIVLPQIRLGVAAAWVIAFILAFGELGVSVLVAPPGEATLPIRIYTLIANTPASHVATLALLQSVIVFTPLVVFAAAASLRENG